MSEIYDHFRTDDEINAALEWFFDTFHTGAGEEERYQAFRGIILAGVREEGRRHIRECTAEGREDE